MLFPENDRPNASWFSKPGAERAVSAVERTIRELRLDPDIWQRWINLGREFSIDDVVGWRDRAHTGRVREWATFGREAQRTGFTTQILKLREHIRGAEYRFTLAPGAQDGARVPLDDEMKKLAGVALEYFEEESLEQLPDMWASSGVDGAYFGWAGAAPSFEPRGFRDRWDHLIEFKQVASHRFEWDLPSRAWRVYYDGLLSKYLPVSALVDDAGLPEAADVAAVAKAPWMPGRGSLMFLEIDAAHPLDQRGLLWMLVTLWVFCQYMLRYWVETVEDTGKPIFKATFKAGQKNAQKTAEDAIDALAHDLRAAIPDTVGVEWLAAPSPAAGQNGGPHQQLLEWLFRTFDQIILGHSHASGAQVGTGSRTSGDKAEKETIRKVNGILRTLSAWTTRQYLLPTLARQLGRRDLARLVAPRLEVKMAQDPDYLTESQIIANAVGAGVPIDPDEATEAIGYATVPPGKRVLVPAGTMAAPAPADAPDAAKASPADVVSWAQGRARAELARGRHGGAVASILKDLGSYSATRPLAASLTDVAIACASKPDMARLFVDGLKAAA